MEKTKSFEVITRDYAAEIEAVLSRPLTPANIDKFAENALDDLISIVRDVEVDYSSRPSINYLTSRENEEAAFSYFGLTDVERLLDNIATRADEVAVLDDVLAQASPLADVTIPAGAGNINSAGKNSKLLELPDTAPKAKTVLYILQQEFGVDLTNEQEFEITIGQVSKTSFRNHPYYQMQVKKADLKRLIFVCDELENVSFVFDSEEVRARGYDVDQLQAMTKNELSYVIESNPTIGQKRKFTKNFPGLIKASIANPNTVLQEAPPVTLRTSTVELAQDGEISLKAASRELGVSQSAIESVYERMLGEGRLTERHRVFRSMLGRALSPAELSDMKQLLVERGTLAPAPDPGELSINGLAKALGATHYKINEVIDELLQEGLIEPPVNKKVSSKTVPVIGLAAQERVADRLLKSGYYTPRPEAGELSIEGLAKAINLSPQSVSKIVSILNERGDVPELPLRRFGPVIAESYNEDMKQLVIQEAESQGMIAPDAAPEDKKFKELAGVLGVSDTTIANVAKSLSTDSQFGPLSRRRFTDSKRSGSLALTRAQQIQITKVLVERGVVAQDKLDLLS